jgi:large subunit ribosomal protein L9
MEVILKEEIKNLGKAGQVVKVNDGYARNYLLPSGKAVIATEKGVKAVQEQVKQKQEKISAEEQAVKDLTEKLNSVEITLKKLASDDDKLFGSVTEAEIADELKKAGYAVDKTSIALEKHIKELGVFSVPLKFKFDRQAKVKLWIVREGKKKGE